MAGLPPAATGLEGSDARTAWPGPAHAIAPSDVRRCSARIARQRSAPGRAETSKVQARWSAAA